jgi:hypothetical protein
MVRERLGLSGTRSIMAQQKIFCWRRSALRFFLSEQLQQHFVSRLICQRGIPRTLSEQLCIKRDVCVVDEALRHDLHGRVVQGCAQAGMVSEQYCSPEQVIRLRDVRQKENGLSRGPLRPSVAHGAKGGAGLHARTNTQGR